MLMMSFNTVVELKKHSAAKLESRQSDVVRRCSGLLNIAASQPSVADPTMQIASWAATGLGETANTSAVTGQQFGPTFRALLLTAPMQVLAQTWPKLRASLAEHVR